MKAGEAIAEILKREGVDHVFAYPVNFVIEPAAKLGIRPVIVRQERVGLHMADAVSRVTSGKNIGVFAMQHGPGAENSFGGVAQAFGDSAPILVLPMGYARSQAYVDPNFSSARSMTSISKSVEYVNLAAEIPNIFRRAFTQLRNGRGGPCVVEIPADVFRDELPGPLVYEPTKSFRYGPDPDLVREAIALLLKAERPVIYAGQGIHYSAAWPQLRKLAELLAIPVCTSLEGKSAFPEDHPLSLGSGGGGMPKQVRSFLDNADVILGLGCSFTDTRYGVSMPKGKILIQNTIDPAHLNKDIPIALGLVGDSGLTLDALLAEAARHVKAPRDSGPIVKAVAAERDAWLAQWHALLISDEVPLTPYRVIWDLWNNVDVANTIITHDAGSPRDQLSPFWKSTTPLSYIGWGKTTQLGTGLGFAMGAQLIHPDKLCINVWGDAAIGFTGMDFETAVRERIPILSILFNNFGMSDVPVTMPHAAETYGSTNISGDYAAMARAFGGFGERVTEVSEIIPAIKRGIASTKKGVPALLEFITRKETRMSRFP